MSVAASRSLAPSVALVVIAMATSSLVGCTKAQSREVRHALYKANTPERAEITVVNVVVEKAPLAPGEASTISADLSNGSRMGTGPMTVNLDGYRDPNDPRTKASLGRVHIEEGLEPGQSRRVSIPIQAPSVPGTYSVWFGFQGSQQIKRAEGSAAPLVIEVR